jgi:hypothetical protein
VGGTGRYLEEGLVRRLADQLKLRGGAQGAQKVLAFELTDTTSAFLPLSVCVRVGPPAWP